MQLQYRLLPLFDAMIGQPEFPEGFRRGALARGWDLGPSRQPLSPEQLQAAQKTQEQLAQFLRELSDWLPDIVPAQPSSSGNQPDALPTDDFIEKIVREVMQQLG